MPPVAAHDEKAGAKYYFQCPQCSNEASFYRVEQESSGAGCLLLTLGGVFPALLYASTTGPRVQCTECGYIFSQPALPRTRASTLALWALGLILSVGTVAFILAAGPGEELFPESPVLSRVWQGIMNYPKPILAAVGAVFVACLAISWVSDGRAHRELRKQFLIQPTKYGEGKRAD